MNKDNFKTFNEYLEEMMPTRISMDMRSDEEIMQEIAEIENKFRKEE